MFYLSIFAYCHSFLMYVSNLISNVGFYFFFFSCSSREPRFSQKLIVLLQRLNCLIPWCCPLVYLSISRLFFPVSELTVFQSCFMREGNVLFFSDIILFTIFIFISSTCVCVVVLTVFQPLLFSVWFWLVDWLVEFYGISTFENYLMPNPFLCKC